MFTILYFNKPLCNILRPFKSVFVINFDCQSIGDQKTVVIAPTGLFPGIVSCVSAIQGSTEANVTLHYPLDM